MEQITAYQRKNGKTFREEETAALSEKTNVQENNDPAGKNVQESEQSNRKNKNRGD